MAGYWSSSFFACLLTETDLRSTTTQKKERAQYPTILTEKGWSIKDNTINLRDTAGSPERARYRHLADSGSQSLRRIRFILPLHGASQIIKIILDTKSHPT